jgi:hypothetical protein
MSLVSFEFSRKEQGDLSGFDLGDMVLVIGPHRHSSAGRTPSQSMMIYLAIADLVTGLCKLVNGGAKTFEFVGADSSYSLSFSIKRNKVSVFFGRKPVGEVPVVDFLGALSVGVQKFLADPRNQLSANDPANEDLQAALVALKRTTNKAG